MSRRGGGKKGRKRGGERKQKGEAEEEGTEERGREEGKRRKEEEKSRRLGEAEGRGWETEGVVCREAERGFLFSSLAEGSIRRTVLLAAHMMCLDLLGLQIMIPGCPVPPPSVRSKVTKLRNPTMRRVCRTLWSSGWCSRTCGVSWETTHNLPLPSTCRGHLSPNIKCKFT